MLTFPRASLHSRGPYGPVTSRILADATAGFPLLHSENVLAGKPGGESGVDTVTTTRTGRVVKRVVVAEVRDPLRVCVCVCVCVSSVYVAAGG